MERISSSFLSIVPSDLRYNASMTHASLLKNLIDLHSALKSDRMTDPEERKRRDRRIGQALESSKSRPDKQIRGWLEQVKIEGLIREGRRGVQLYHLLCMVLALVGLIMGWLLAQAVLYYTGASPINIVNALALLVLPQILLLLIWLVSSMPWKIPLFESARSTLQLLNPGRLAHHFALFSSARRRQNLAVLWDQENMIALMPASQWLFSFWSQLFALCFNAGILLSAFYMISFSDLAFAWSTTLHLESVTFHRWLHTLSLPWSELLPSAVPSLELVEVSRYYRLEGVSLGDSAAVSNLAIHLGQWWPFLLASVACYGFVPRLLTLVISWFRLHHHLRRSLSLLPGATDLLARMNSPLISTASLQPEYAVLVDSSNEPSVSRSVDYDLKCVVVPWSGAGDQSGALAKNLAVMGIEPLAFLPAGGANSMDQDSETIASLENFDAEGVALIVKAWEPPLLELLDFIASIRASSDRQLPIIVLLWGGDYSVTAEHCDTWQVSLRQLKDPGLHVEALGFAT